MSDADNIPHWPDECPACGNYEVEENPHTLSWYCPKCGCDEESMEQDKADDDRKAVQEGL